MCQRIGSMHPVFCSRFPLLMRMWKMHCPNVLHCPEPCAGFGWDKANLLVGDVCFGFVLKQCWQHRTLQILLSRAYTVKAFAASYITCQQVSWRWARSWKGTQLGRLTPADQRDIPDHMTSCTTIKGAWKEGRSFPEMLLLGDWLGIGWLVEASGVSLYHLVVVGVYFALVFCFLSQLTLFLLGVGGK